LFQVKDDWNNTPPMGLVVKQWDELPEDQVIPVPGNYANEAITLLDKASFLTFEKTTLSRFWSPPPPTAKGCKPYLVRALRFVGQGGGFRVEFRDKAIRVMYGLTAHYNPEVKRAPVVVWLPWEPECVYVEIHVVEKLPVETQAVYPNLEAQASFRHSGTCLTT
jgi:hypothetical protein